MPRRRISEDEWEEEKMVGGQQRNAANARERARMRVLSRAFCRLKTTLPWVPADTKLSKLDTLRLATSYIAHLRAMLCLDQDDDLEPTNAVHPLNLTWPFSFQPSPNGSGGGNATNGIGNHGDASSWNDHHSSHHHHNAHHNTSSLSPMSSPTERDEDNIYEPTFHKNDIDSVNSSHYIHNNNTEANTFNNHQHSNHNHSNFHDSLLQIG